MQRLKFEIKINAPREKVWETLWNDATYRQWTAAFSEGSYAESDWQEGSKILFLGPDGSGMFAIIEKKIELVQMSFRHLGEVKSGAEVPMDWEDATENYYLNGNNGTTDLTVEMGTTEDFADYLSKTFPTALNKLKEVAEQ